LGHFDLFVSLTNQNSIIIFKVPVTWIPESDDEDDDTGL
jgi:hypothetical protein